MSNNTVMYTFTATKCPLYEGYLYCVEYPLSEAALYMHIFCRLLPLM